MNKKYIKWKFLVNDVLYISDFDGIVKYYKRSSDKTWELAPKTDNKTSLENLDKIYKRIETLSESDLILELL